MFEKNGKKLPFFEHHKNCSWWFDFLFAWHLTISNWIESEQFSQQWNVLTMVSCWLRARQMDENVRGQKFQIVLRFVLHDNETEKKMENFHIPGMLTDFIWLVSCRSADGIFQQKLHFLRYCFQPVSNSNALIISASVHYDIIFVVIRITAIHSLQYRIIYRQPTFVLRRKKNRRYMKIAYATTMLTKWHWSKNKYRKRKSFCVKTSKRIWGEKLRDKK